jgi:prefoldin subunit 5
VFAAVKPIKDDLQTIKGQLGEISDTVNDLLKRIEQIEKLLKEQQKKKAE